MYGQACTADETSSSSSAPELMEFNGCQCCVCDRARRRRKMLARHRALLQVAPEAGFEVCLVYRSPVARGPHFQFSSFSFYEPTEGARESGPPQTIQMQRHFHLWQSTKKKPHTFCIGRCGHDWPPVCSGRRLDSLKSPRRLRAMRLTPPTPSALAMARSKYAVAAAASTLFSLCPPLAAPVGRHTRPCCPVRARIPTRCPARCTSARQTQPGCCAPPPLCYPNRAL